MSVIPMDNTHMTLMLQNDAQQLRTTLAWVQQRYQTWNQIGTAANLTTAGITGQDQTNVLAFFADIGRLSAFMTGTPQAVAADMRVDIVNVIGVM